eukprot:COSAG04_NODE_618_length_11896_cov_81.925659_25_plen_74_part_00
MYNGEGAWDGRQALADCREDWLADVARFGAESFLPCCTWAVALCVACLCFYFVRKLWKGAVLKLCLPPCCFLN